MERQPLIRDVVYNKPQLVVNVKDIYRGDHVAFKRGLYYHHAVVIHIDWDSEVVMIIEYNTEESTSRMKSLYDISATSQIKAKVIQNTIRFTERTFYKIYHKERLDVNRITNRAHSRLGEQKYNLFYNNCEHFANWCVIGESVSHQALPMLLISNPGLAVLSLKMARGDIRGFINGLTLNSDEEDGSYEQQLTSLAMYDEKLASQKTEYSQLSVSV